MKNVRNINQKLLIKIKTIALGIVLKKEKNNMIELTCKICDDVTIKCDEDVVAVTCGTCSMTDLIDKLENQIVGIA